MRLQRTRSPRPLPRFQLEVVSDGLLIRSPAAWLEKHPLTSADREEEEALVAGCGIRLRVEPA